MTTIVRIPYEPRSFQADIHKELDQVRWSVLVMHRRFGKTYLLLNQLIKKAVLSELPDSRYVYIAPYLKQAKTLAWDYLKRFTDPIPGRKYSESELKVTLPNGAQIRLFGADNPDALRGIYVDGAVLDEYAQCNPTIFSSILRPALSDRKGWCVFSGTPNGKNHFYDQLQHAKITDDWYWCVLTASDTGIVSEQELEDARRTMTEEEYEREYECSFNSIIGKKIYPEFRRSLHVAEGGKGALFPKHPVEIIRGWDNTGLNPAITYSYFNEHGQWCIFKEFPFFDVGMIEATETIVHWSNLMLPQGCTFVDYGDPAGRIRDTIKGSARDYIAQKAKDMGTDLFIIDGVQTWKIRRESVANRLTKLTNGRPAILIDEECELLVEGFEGGYAYRELANMPGMYVEEAVKNKYSHIHDALQYPATRLFTHSNNRVIMGSVNTEFYDEDEYFYEEESTGRSSIGGY